MNERKIKIHKLDARFNGFGSFTRMIDYRLWLGRHQLFMQHRLWFWDQFGPGCELGFLKYQLLQPLWTWDTEHGHLRLYTNEKELGWFQLKWG